MKHWSPPNLCVNLSAFAEDLEKRIAEDEENNTGCVCYELSDSVPLNTCCHKLCSECYYKLDTCPMCRTLYREKPPEDETFHWWGLYDSIRNIPNFSREYILQLNGNSYDEVQVKLFTRIYEYLYQPAGRLFVEPERMVIGRFRDPQVVINVIRTFHTEQEAANIERVMKNGPVMYQFIIEHNQRMRAVFQ